MKSIWEKGLGATLFKTNKSELLLSKSKRKKYKQEYEKDIVIAGGGIAGFLCAYLLTEEGHKVSLIEANKLFSGVTKNTTAHITALQGKYKDIPSKKRRKEYFNSQIQAIDEIEKLVKKHNILCDFKRADSFLFGEDESKNKLKKEYKALKKIGADVEYLENQNFLFGTFNVVKLKNQASFNPIKFLKGLPTKFEIIEDSRILKANLCKKTLETNNNIFKAKKIIFATNFPIVNIRGLYAFKMYKSISYAVHIKTEKRVNALFNSIEDDGLTYRDTETGVIVGGLDHRSGRITSCGKLKQLAASASMLGGKCDAEWVANDCITFDSIPYAGRFKLISKGVYVISGFGKWGMTNSFICGKVVTDIISKRANVYKKLFKPTRILHIKIIFKFLFNAIYNIFNISKSFISMPFKTHKSLKKGQGSVVWYGVKKRAVYKDDTGKLHILSPMCPHMLCQLKFNPNAKTWDCPCHGSRLTVNGQIIAEPTIRSNIV